VARRRQLRLGRSAADDDEPVARLARQGEWPGIRGAGLERDHIARRGAVERGLQAAARGHRVTRPDGAAAGASTATRGTSGASVAAAPSTANPSAATAARGTRRRRRLITPGS
jgi:hypothetical protein